MLVPRRVNKPFARWWFQSTHLKCVDSSNWIISPSRGENKKYWKASPSFEVSTLRRINKPSEQRWVIWIFRRFSEVSTGYQRMFLVVFLERIPNKIETNLLSNHKFLPGVGIGCNPDCTSKIPRI